MSPVFLVSCRLINMLCLSNDRGVRMHLDEKLDYLRHHYAPVVTPPPISVLKNLEWYLT